MDEPPKETNFGQGGRTPGGGNQTEDKSDVPPGLQGVVTVGKRRFILVSEGKGPHGKEKFRAVRVTGGKVPVEEKPGELK